MLKETIIRRRTLSGSRQRNVSRYVSLTKDLASHRGATEATAIEDGPPQCYQFSNRSRTHSIWRLVIGP